MKKFTLLLVVIVLIHACKSKTLEEKFSITTYQADIEFFAKKSLIDGNSKSLLLSYISTNMNDSVLLSKSYASLLNDAISEDNYRKETRGIIWPSKKQSDRKY